MAARARTHATYEDLIRVPEHLVAEIIDGDLYTSPRPGGPHAMFASALGMDIGSPYHRGRGGPGGWRRERMPEVPRNQIFSITPDWVCEVLSPSTSRLDRTKKVPIYPREGVAFLWLIDPIERVVETYRLQDSAWTLMAAYGGNDKFRAEPFELVEIDLPSIWGETPDEASTRPNGLQ